MDAPESNQLDSSFLVAAVSVLCYDYLLTLPKEVHYIWKRHLSPFAVAFLVIRYLPFFDTAILAMIHEFAPNMSTKACSITFWVQAWSYYFSYNLVECILAVRTCAVYNNKKSVAISLGVLWFVYVTPATFFFVIFLMTVQFDLAPVTRECTITQAGELLYIPFDFLLAYNTVVLVLIVRKALQDAGYRFWKWNGATLFHLVYRDGILFYVLLLLISVVNTALMDTLPDYAKTCMTVLHRVLHSILASHLVLNIRANVITSMGESSLVGDTSTSVENDEESPHHLTLPGIETGPQNPNQARCARRGGRGDDWGEFSDDAWEMGSIERGTMISCDDCEMGLTGITSRGEIIKEGTSKGKGKEVCRGAPFAGF